MQNVLVEHRLAPAADRLVATGLPVRLLHGERDKIAPLASARELAVGHSWSLDILASGDHHLPARHPSVCARWLLAA